MDGRHARAERTRTAILGASVKLIALGGLPALTQRRVASEAGTSLASVTYHFPSLDDLTCAALEEASRQVMDRARRLREEVGDECDDPLSAAAGLLIAEITDPESPVGVMLEGTLAARRRPILRPALDAAQAELEAVFTPFMESAEDARALARAFQGIALWGISRGSDADQSEIHAALVRTWAAFGVSHHSTHDTASRGCART